MEEHRGRVLLVDDEPALLRVVARYIRTKGFQVAEAKDGATAITMLRSAEFDVVVSDINMPGMSGIKLLRTVREYDLDLPVILMTAAPAVETAVLAVEYGALRYLMKPVALDELESVVQYAVRLRKMALLKRAALAHLGAPGELPGDRAGLDARFTLALNGVWMAFQPLVSWSRREVVAHEALLRSTEASLSNPAALLAAAERLGQLPILGQTIRSRIADAMDAMPDPPQVFVNLHPQDLVSEDLFSADHPLTRHAPRIVLEITERATLDGVPNVRERAALLRAMGFRIAVDDLGAGYAGLSSVVQLEPEILKFDMTLVRDIDRQPTKQRLVRSMIDLCKDMGVLAVAEGIETPAERNTLASLGCDVLQGYLFARPAGGFVEPVWDAVGVA